MKNNKNNFSKKSFSNENKNSELRKKSESSNFQVPNNDERNFKDKNRNNFKNLNQQDNPRKNKFRQSKINDKISNDSKNRSYKNKPLRDSSSIKNLKNNQYSSINKNFDDWIWGKHAVLACFNSERPINRIWCTSDIYSSEKFYLKLKQLKSQGILIEEVSWSRLTQITFGSVHQGIALQLASSKTVNLHELINSAKNKATTPILVALDGITDPHNLGAIIRSAEAFNCDGIIIPQRRSAGLTGTVAKVAAGALEHISVSRVINLNRALDELKKEGFLVVGLSGDGQLALSKFEKNKLPLVVIIGSENKGISLLSQKKCDHLIKIPLKGVTSSLNASVAAAISFYHLSNP